MPAPSCRPSPPGSSPSYAAGSSSIRSIERRRTDPMKLLVADKFEKVGIDGLKDLGCQVVLQPDVNAEDLAAAIREANAKVLVVRTKKVNEPPLGAGPALSLVIRAGAGIDNIDVAAASRLRGVVSKSPGQKLLP